MAYLRGIDVSKWQGLIDWIELSKQDINYAFIKASEATWTDPRFAYNWENSLNAKITRAPYHFFRGNVDALSQATFFCNLITTRGKYLGELPPALDFETRDGIVPMALTKKVFIFLRECENRLGIKPIIYTCANAFDNYLTRTTVAQQYLLWVANYEVLSPRIPVDWKKYGKTWTFWQYTSRGLLKGVQSKSVDLNWYNGDLEAFRTQFKIVEEIEEPVEEKPKTTTTIPLIFSRFGRKGD